LAIEPDFLATADIANDTPVAYHSRRALAMAGLERRFGRLLTVRVAFQVEKANSSRSPMSARSPRRNAPSITSWWARRPM
jgi:hypothetical protein